jgi:hypothetical protein
MGPTDRDDESTLGQGADDADEIDLQVVAANRWFVLAETRDGYGIWRGEDDRTDPPLAEFGEDEEGFAEAEREYRRRTRAIRLFAIVPTYLAWAVVVGVTLWVVANVLISLWSLNLIRLETVAFDNDLFVWVQAIISVTYALWVGSLAILIMLWLLRRSRDDRIV